MRRDLTARGPQRVGLGLAPPLGDRLREVREERRQPEHGGDSSREAEGGVPHAVKRKNRDGRGEYRRNIYQQHHRVFRLRGGRELYESGFERLRGYLAV